MKKLFIISMFSVLSIANIQDSFAGKSRQSDKGLDDQEVNKMTTFKKPRNKTKTKTKKLVPMSPMKRGSSTWHYWENKRLNPKNTTLFRDVSNDEKNVSFDFFTLEDK